VIGQTKDVGFQIGVSRTIPFSAATVWDFLVSSAGLAVWLGEGARLVPEKGARYETTNGTVGEVRSFRYRDRIRLTWRPADWDHDSTVQVAMVDRGDRTRLVFHQEWLAGPEERLRQRTHWQGVLAKVIDALAASG
jgi:uncharacterized protein YndB with AHSA1/START domain